MKQAFRLVLSGRLSNHDVLNLNTTVAEVRITSKIYERSPVELYTV